MRINSKGQVTIPRRLRERTGLLPHTDVTFGYSAGKVILRPSRDTGAQNATRIRAAINSSRGSANEPMFKGWGTGRIMAFLRPE